MYILSRLVARILLTSIYLTCPNLAIAEDTEIDSIFPTNDATSALTPITVTADHKERLKNQVFMPINVVDRNELDLRQARGIDDIFSALPGVTSSGGPRRDAMMPMIRGLSDGRVVVRINGARQNFQRDHRSQTYFDPSLLQRVEILRGPASSLYGSGAIGGVVDFHTLNPRSFLGPGDRFGGRMIGSYQSNANEQMGALTVACQLGDFGLLSSITRSRSDDYKDGSGNIEPFSSSDVTAGLFKVSWDINSVTDLTAAYLDFYDNSPSHSTADRPFDFDRLPLRSISRKTRQRTASLRYSYAPLSGILSDLNATFYYTDLNQQDQTFSDSGRLDSNIYTLGLDIYNTTQFNFASFNHTLSAGFELYGDRQRGRRNSIVDLGFSDSEQFTFGVFAQHNITLNSSTNLVLGLRYDHIWQEGRISSTPDAAIFNELSPQTTLIYHLTNNFNVFASYAEAFRAPSLTERFIGGIHFGNNVFIPNPDLKPERAHNKEIGARYLQRGIWHYNDRLSGQLSLYQNDVDNFIEQVVRRGDVIDFVLANTTRFENVVHARLRGIELDLSYDHPRFRVRLIGNLIRGDALGRGTPLENMPADNLVLLSAIKFPDQQLEVGKRVKLTFRQDRLPLTTDPDAPGPAAGYILTDLFIMANISSYLRVDLALNNVFDRNYREATNLINGRGRNFKAQIIYKF